MTQGQAAHLRDLSQREEQRRLSKEELLRPRIVEREEFIEGLGGTVKLRSLSHAARQELRQKSGFGTPEFDDELFTNLTIVYSVIDPDLRDEDIEALRQQDVTIYEDLVLRISMLNMIGRTDDLKKDSSPTLNFDSPSGSANDSG